MLEEDVEKNQMNELGRQKSDRQILWQQVKHAKLYIFWPAPGFSEEYLIALDTQQRES